MRAVGLTADVFVVTSAIWQTTCTLVNGGGGPHGPGAQEAFVIDSPMLPEEIDALPDVAYQAGFRVVGLLATHADFDHVLARYAFPEVPLGVAPDTAERLRSGDAQRELRAWDDTWYVERPGPLALGTPQVLPVPGRVDLGLHELELHPTPGHTPDGMAVYVPWARVLVCGDYLSPVEIPWLGEREAYLETLDRLEPLVAASDWVVPGHGGPIDSARAAAILREDRAYLEALPDAELPLARRTRAQQRIHAENVERLTG